MQAVDLPCNPSLDHRRPDPSAMSEHYSPIHSPNHHPENKKSHVENNVKSEKMKENNVRNSSVSDNNGSSSVVVRRERPSRACTQRAAARMQAAAEAEAAMAEAERKRKKSKRKERLAARLLKEDSEEEENGFREEEEDGEKKENGEEHGSSSLSRLQSSRMVTPLLGEPEASQLPRWKIRSKWQLASILNFLNVFRPLLNIKVEFSAEEFETALITPNNTLADIHMPLLKAIPPVTRMALGHATWITVLCRKLRDWWYWVAEGDLPIVASHGTEVEAYNALDPGVRVIILKALCDIRVEQEDIRNYIDDSIKHGVQLSTFRRERLGGDSYGVSYWYEDDPMIGHRLYREIRKVEVKKGKGRNIPPIPHSSYQWEAVATNLDEFQNVSEKLFSSKNRTEVSVGKKLKNEMLPEIEKIHKRKEKLLKKQHRQALMLDSMISMDGLAAGRSLRDRKPVTYTFDDYDRSINEALKVTKKQQSTPEPFDGREPRVKLEVSTNGRLHDPSHHSQPVSFRALSPKSPEDDEFYDDHRTETLDRSNRRRQRPQRYSAKEFVEAVSDNEADFDSDDDIVGEVVYDDDYLRRRKQRKMSSSSEGDEEYHWDEENHEEEEEEEEEDDNYSMSEDSDKPRRFKPLPGRTRREAKLRSVDELQSGLRRSKRATRTRINYKQYEMSESDTEPMKREKSNVLDEHSYSSDNAEFSAGSQDTDEKINEQEIHANQPNEDQHPEMVGEKRTSKRTTRTRINFRRYAMSESDTESMKPEKSNALDEHSYSSGNAEFSRGSQDSDEKINEQEIHANQPIEEQHPEIVDEKRNNKRATRSRVNFRQYIMSESDTESMKREKSNALDEHSYSSGNADFSRGSQESDEKINAQEIHANQPIEEQQPEMVDEKQTNPPEQKDHRDQEEDEGVRKRRFLDLNELAPGSGFDDGPNLMRDEDRDDF